MGAWIERTYLQALPVLGRVAPRVGAWIESLGYRVTAYYATASLPVWERGLKALLVTLLKIVLKVAPRVGAWIESRRSSRWMMLPGGRSPCGSVD